MCIIFLDMVIIIMIIVIIMEEKNIPSFGVPEDVRLDRHVIMPENDPSNTDKLGKYRRSRGRDMKTITMKFQQTTIHLTKNKSRANIVIQGDVQVPIRSISSVEKLNPDDHSIVPDLSSMPAST